MTTSPHVLYLLRHAEPETFAPDHKDASRRLTDAGKAQAARTGEALKAMSPAPDRVLVSTAMRTRQTAEALRLGVNLDYLDAMYGCSMLTLTEELTCVPEEVGAVLLVGHSPSIPTLASALADPARSDATALERLRQGYPTATLCRIELDGRWDQAGELRGRLTDVVWS